MWGICLCVPFGAISMFSRDPELQGSQCYGPDFEGVLRFNSEACFGLGLPAPNSPSRHVPTTPQQLA